ncbi:MAG: hypothetical protein DHS20C03_01270 [Minwuia thermotolerans]|nr:MAG: hypothetical protein DHS20C03_01270 [Minwuia thermotolerans]
MTIANDESTGKSARTAVWQPSAMTGILFMCLAISMFPPMNATVKYLGEQGYPYGQVVWARYAGHFVFMVLAFAPRFGMSLFITHRPGVQGMRSLLLFACTALYFYALQYVDLTLAASISFTSPILLTALSVPFLGEKVGARRWIAVFIGFAGALIIIRPGHAEFHWATLLLIGNTICYAFYQVLTRKISAEDTPETTITYTALVGCIIASFLLINGMEMPRSTWHWFLFISMGALGGFGHYFVVKAFQHARASVVAPFGYGQLIGATLLGYFVFGTFPDQWTWIGAAIIVCSGLYIVYREQKVTA